MGLLSRLGNVFRGERMNRDIQEEMEAHLAEAVAEGRDPVEARRAFGSAVMRGEGESYSEGGGLAGFVARGCCFWVAAIDEAEGDDGSGGGFAGAGDWGLHFGVSVGGCYVAKAAAD